MAGSRRSDRAGSIYSAVPDTGGLGKLLSRAVRAGLRPYRFGQSVTFADGPGAPLLTGAIAFDLNPSTPLRATPPVVRSPAIGRTNNHGRSGRRPGVEMKSPRSEYHADRGGLGKYSPSGTGLRRERCTAGQEVVLGSQPGPLPDTAFGSV